MTPLIIIALLAAFLLHARHLARRFYGIKLALVETLGQWLVAALLVGGAASVVALAVFLSKVVAS